MDKKWDKSKRLLSIWRDRHNHGITAQDAHKDLTDNSPTTGKLSGVTTEQAESLQVKQDTERQTEAEIPGVAKWTLRNTQMRHING